MINGSRLSVYLKSVGWLRSLCLGAGLLYAIVAVLALFVVPASYPLRLPLLLVLYVCVAGFAAAAAFRAARMVGGLERWFWSAVGAGVGLRVLGDVGWAYFGESQPAQGLDALYQAAWMVSYLLLFVALGFLVVRVNRRLALLAAMDSVAVMITVGIMAYYFVVEPILANPDGLLEEVWIGLPSLVPELLRRPVADVTLFFLSLSVLSAERKPRSAGLLCAGLLAFCVADALLLRAGAVFADYEADSALGAFWAAGLVLFGAAALSSRGPGVREESLASTGSRSGGSPEAEEAEPWRAVLFWLGPLSPAMLYGFLLLWVAFSDNVPVYVFAGAALVLVYLALRISVLMYVNRRLSGYRDERVRRVERGRIASELDETLLRRVHDLPSLLDSYRRYKDTDPGAAEEVLRRAEREAREASYRISYPVRELKALAGDTAIGPDVLVDQLLSEVETNFGMRIHRDLEASPEDLTAGELASIYRVVSEALWNAAKHSRASNIWVSTRYVGSIFLVKVHDDGRGYDTSRSYVGLGVPLMRGRAAGMGAALDLISKPGAGTTVQIRFDAGRRKRH